MLRIDHLALRRADETAARCVRIGRGLRTLIVRSSPDDNQAKELQHHGEGEQIEKKQNNDDERAAALSGSFNPAQGDVADNNRCGPQDRPK
jgi:hypothetical protein